MKIFALIFLFCISFAEARKEKKIDQLELQEDLQRFYTRFTQRTLEGLLNPKIINNVKLREDAMRKYLLYDSEALKITTGPYPELNLLDMLVFIKLNKLLIKNWWIPNLWKEHGVSLLNSFRDSEKEINKIALKVLTTDEVKQVNRVVKRWRKENPNIHYVERIRLADFSQYATATQQRQEEGKGFSLSNLLVDTKGAVKAVDQMVLVANRAIFLAQYLPALVRLQVRVGTQELIDDVVVRMSEADAKIDGLNETRPMLVTMSGLTKNLDVLARDVSSLVKTFKKEFPNGVNATGNLKEVHQIVDKIHILMKELKGLRTENDVLKTIKKDFRDVLIFIALLFVAVGGVISVFWWTGAYIVKRAILQKETKGQI